MPTRLTVIHTENYLGVAQIASIFSDVMAHNTAHELIETQAHGVVSFVLYETPLQIDIFRFHKLITDRDPLAEIRVNGQTYSLSTF